MKLVLEFGKTLEVVDTRADGKGGAVLQIAYPGGGATVTLTAMERRALKAAL